MKINALLLFLFLALSVVSVKSQEVGNCLHFSGSNSWINAPVVPDVFQDFATNAFTVELWLKIDTHRNQGVFRAQYGNSFVQILITDDGHPIFYIVKGYPANLFAKSLKTANPLATETWHHLAITWDGNTDEMKIFINGVNDPGSYAGSATTLQSDALVIGYQSGAGNHFKGSMDEIKIWDKALSTCERRRSMIRSYKHVPDHLVASYNFNQGIPAGDNASITEALDLTSNHNATFFGFNLTGSTSNFVSSNAGITMYLTNNSSSLTVNVSGAIYQWVDCNNGASPIPGATSQSFTPTTNGTYACIVYYNSCTDYTDCETIANLKLDDLNSLHEFKLYPNPNNGDFTITFAEQVAPQKIRITNTLGQTIYQTSTSLKSTKLNLSLDSGMYYLTIGGIRKSFVVH